jgi:TetR/AcrR family transcriptional regulator
MEISTKHLPADERRALTIAAVIELAGAHNPSEITTSAIAQKMGLTQGALFRHFSTKEALWQAVMEWVKDRLLVRINQAALNIKSPLAALEAIFMNHIEFVIEHPGVPRMLFGELQRAEPTPAKRVAHSLVQLYIERICACIEQGKAIKEISLDVDTRSAATLFLGTVQGLVMQSLLTGDIQRIRTEAPGVFIIYRRGIRGEQ